MLDLLSARLRCRRWVLSVRVGGDRIQPRTPLLQEIKEYPRPETKKQVISFLGLVGYYRKFIPNFSERAAVLTNLTKGKNPSKVEWSTNHELAFHRKLQCRLPLF